MPADSAQAGRPPQVRSAPAGLPPAHGTGGRVMESLLSLWACLVPKSEKFSLL